MERFDGDGYDFAVTPDYEIEPNAEHPGDGVWRHPVYQFDADGRVREDAERSGEPPRVVLVRPAVAPPWIGVFRHGGFGGADGIYAMPDPSLVCVIVRGDGYLVDVRDPGAGAEVVPFNIQHMGAVSDPALALMADYTSIEARDANGVAWRTPDLFLDDTRIVGVREHLVRVAGLIDYDGLTGEVTLDARSGLAV